MPLNSLLIVSLLVSNVIGEVRSTVVGGDFAAALVEDDECHARTDVSSPAECALELTQIRASKLLPLGSKTKIAALVDTLPHTAGSNTKIAALVDTLPHTAGAPGSGTKIAALMDTAPSHRHKKKADVLSTTADEAGAVVAKLEAERRRLFLKEMGRSAQEVSFASRGAAGHASAATHASAQQTESDETSQQMSSRGATHASAQQTTSDAASQQMSAREAEWQADFERALASPKMTLSKASSKHLRASSEDAGYSTGSAAAVGADYGLDYGHPEWLPFCQKIFLDLGATLGVNARKVFEPKKYPNSTFLQILDSAIGNPGWRRADFSKTGLCVLGLEPNPEHQEHLAALEKAYQERGWMVHFYDFAAWSTEGFMAFNATSERPTPEANKTSAGAHLMMKATQQQQGEDDPALMVRTVDLAAFIHSLPHRTVDLMVMDIEGAEYESLARLIQRNLLCERRIQTVLVSAHEWGEILHWGKEDAFLNTTHPRSFTAVQERRDQLQGVRWCDNDNVSTIIALPDDANYTQDVDSSFAQLSTGTYGPVNRLSAELGGIGIASLTSLQNSLSQASSLPIAQAVSSQPYAQAFTSQLADSQVSVASMQPPVVGAAQDLPFQLRRIPAQARTTPMQASPVQPPASMLGASMIAAPMRAAPVQTPMQHTLPLATAAQAVPAQRTLAQAAPASQA